jgi:hypothetical protein
VPKKVGDEVAPRPVSENAEVPKKKVVDETAPQPVSGNAEVPKKVVDETAPQPVSGEGEVPKKVGDERAPLPVSENAEVPKKKVSDEGAAKSVFENAEVSKKKVSDNSEDSAEDSEPNDVTVARPANPKKVRIGVPRLRPITSDDGEEDSASKQSIQKESASKANLLSADNVPKPNRISKKRAFFLAVEGEPISFIQFIASQSALLGLGVLILIAVLITTFYFICSRQSEKGANDAHPLLVQNDE